MAYFLFVDESGQDHRKSPYEVLAGVAIEDRDLWNLIKSLQDAELRHFGIRYSRGVSRELKATKLLKSKVFRQAGAVLQLSPEEQVSAARDCITDGDNAGYREITALAKAKIAYVEEFLEICSRFRCHAFASISEESPTSASEDHLRKDYAYLFERFYYFLEDKNRGDSGVIVFDELEKSRSHILIHQMERYFKFTQKGQLRSNLIIPEPFFVHSDLSTGIQIADVAAYLLSWGFRLPKMTKAARPELSNLVELICGLRYKTSRDLEANPDFQIWSFIYVQNLYRNEVEEKRQ